MKGVEKMKPSYNLLTLLIKSTRKVRFYKTYVRNEVIVLGYVVMDQYGSSCKLNLTTGNISVISICRTPTGNCTNFLRGLDTILDLLYSTKIESVVCGDLKNFVDICEKRQQLDTLLATYNLTKVFYNRIQD
jgi:hypothetical protein